MIRYEKVQKETLEPVSIQCNRCGLTKDMKLPTHFTEIRKSYGYGSVKDGTEYLSHVCESCMDEFYSTFKLPPQITQKGIWRE